MDILTYAISKKHGGGGGGSSITVESLSATSNNTYTAETGHAYNPVVVNVPNSYSQDDEGKVVSSGALVSQTARAQEITENGTYPTITNNSVTVNVPTGGGTTSLPAKDVNFRDYDGSIVAAYTAAEFAELSALPSNPDHTSEGLTAQGWNWSLSDAKTYVASYGRLEIGQMYITTDGKTHVHIHLEKGRTSPMLGCCPDGTVDVDWGDGTTHDTLTGTSVSTVKWTPTHNYAAPGDYVIKLTVSNSGGMGFYGSGKANQYAGLLRFSSSGDARNRVYQNSIYEVFIGTGITSIGNNAFDSCINLSIVTIPSSVTNIGDNSFQNCYSLASVAIPSSVTNIGDNSFQNCINLSIVTIPNSTTNIGDKSFYSCTNLSSITIPSSVTSIGNGTFQNCSAISSITIPSSVTSIGTSTFQNCSAISSITIPSSVTSIGNGTFQNCYSLASVAIPSSVTSIGNNGFIYCYGVAEYHVRPTTPPTLGTTVFNGIPADCIIYVPAASVEDYKTAWSDYASYIQAEPA